MATSAAENVQRHFEVQLTAGNHFAWLRTRLALERTVMAWVRTAVALIGFGFTIVQFFERLNSMEGVAAASRPYAARYIGLALIGAGVLALMISIWQYRRMVLYLWHGDFAGIAGVAKGPAHTPVYLIAITMLLVGIFAFLTVLVRAV
jgi:inner membrane protein YidH